MSRMLRTAAIAVFLLPALPAAAGQAATSEAPEVIRLELNRLTPAENGACIVTFVARNGLGDLDRLAYQTVMFDGDGLVERMTIFDFGRIQAGRTVVRQFSLPQLGCDRVSRILINDAPQCAGSGLAPGSCIDRLETANKTEKLFGN